jgi:hypothetical protein
MALSHDPKWAAEADRATARRHFANGPRWRIQGPMLRYQCCGRAVESGMCGRCLKLGIDLMREEAA